MATLVTGLAVAGCGQPSGEVPGQDGQGNHVVHLTANNRFVPDDVRVPVGATVRWLVDGGRHDVNAEDGSFSSSERGLDDEGYPLLLAPGESYNHTFPAKGTWTVWCHTHHEERMKMRLVVE